MAATKLSFSLRTTSNVKQVHLIGSWDSYRGQLPLTREGSKWKGTFRFSSSVIQSGQRYWFYYMLDGYAVSHDPSKDFTVEPTTGRKLNILDVPASSGSEKKKSSSSSSKDSKRSSRRYSREIPRGQPAAEIRSPKPVRPGHLARKLEEAALAELTSKFEAARLAEYDDESDIDSDAESDCPSLSSGGSSVSGRSTPSSVASSVCSCERYGITRRGDRVKLDCGGERCGYDDEDSCGEEEYKVRVSDNRRHAIHG
jgi:hypothetical protein